MIIEFKKRTHLNFAPTGEPTALCNNYTHGMFFTDNHDQVTCGTCKRLMQNELFTRWPLKEFEIFVSADNQIYGPGQVPEKVEVKRYKVKEIPG